MSQSPDLQTQITALQLRLAALDGQGLPTMDSKGHAIVPVYFTSTATCAINGVREDLSQSVMTLEGLLTTVNVRVSALWTALSTTLGITAPPSSGPPTVVPPSGI